MTRWFLLASILLAAQPVLAQLDAELGVCKRAGRPWVSVAFVGAAWEPALRRSVFADLRAELGLSGFDACPLGHRGSEPPLAVIELHAAQRERVSVSIDVHDAVTEKRLARDVELAEVPVDGHALTLAVAADELLRASWAELALVDAPTPQKPPPPQVEEALMRSLRPELKGQAVRPARVGARFAMEYHGGGQFLLGADALVALGFSRRFGMQLVLGARRGLSEQVQSGELRSSALGGGVNLEVALLPSERSLELLLGLGVHASSLSFRGVADGQRVGRQGAAVDLHALSDITLRVPLAGALGLLLRAGAGVPLVSVQARDVEGELSSTDGLQLRGGLGVEGQL